MTSASSVNPDEQEFVVSGASMHMMRKTEMTPDELKTVDVSRRPTTAIIGTTADTMVYVKDWSCSSQSSSSITPAVLSLGNSVQKISSSCEWNAVKLRILLTKTRLHIAIATISCAHYKLCRRVSSEYQGGDTTCVESTLVCPYAYEQFSRAHLMDD